MKTPVTTKMIALAAGFILTAGTGLAQSASFVPDKSTVLAMANTPTHYIKDDGAFVPAPKKQANALDTAVECLEIIGKFDGTVKDFKGTYTVSLIVENSVVDVQTLSVKRMHGYVLSKNKIYTVKVEKDGYIPKLISISTYGADKLDSRNTYTFNFETNLLSMELAGHFDDDDVDFPVALISYNKDCDCFEHNKEYTDTLMQRMMKSITLGGI